MQKWEREAREAIRQQVVPFEPQGASVLFREEDTRCKVTIVWKSKPGIFRFDTNHTKIGPHSVRELVGKARRTMRDLGIEMKEPKPADRVGTLGLALKDALVAKEQPPSIPLPSIDVPPASNGGGLPVVRVTATEPEQPRMLHPTKPPAPANGTNGKHEAAQKEASGPSKLKNHELVTLVRLLTQHGTLDEKNKIFTYNEGWDDERVHALVQTKASLAVITKTRKENFGRTPAEAESARRHGHGPGSRAPIEALEGRCASLEARLSKLEKDLGVGHGAQS